MQYHVTDVFAEAPYAGNQLATFLDAASIDPAEMQQITSAFNFAETTFVTGMDAGGHNVRIFTPGAELPFAGHPILGTAYLLRELVAGGTDEITLNVGVGPIHVTFDSRGVPWMEQNPCTFGPTFERELAADALGLEPGALDLTMPVQEVSTGLATVVIAVRALADLRGIDPDMAAIRAFLRGAESARNMLVVCPEPYEEHQRVAARMFAPDLGVPEDPATGSANGAFAGYVLKHRYSQHWGEAERPFSVGQGYEVGRPSNLRIDAVWQGDVTRIRVGGRVARVAVGEWLALANAGSAA